MLKENFIQILERDEKIYNNGIVFIYKKFSVGNIKLETPTHSISVRGLKNEELIEILDNIDNNVILETRKIFKNNRKYIESLKKALAEYDNDKIIGLFKIKSNLIGRNNLIIVSSFEYNPLETLGKDIYDIYLDYLHEYSGIVFIPNLRYPRDRDRKYSTNSNFTKKYIEYILFTLENITDRNNKPIVFPIDIDFDLNMRTEILKYYRELRVNAIWVDFKGKRSATIKNIPSIRNLIRQIERFLGKDVLIFFSNVKKYLRNVSIIFNNKLPPSDILLPFTYGDIIGTPERKIVPPPNDYNGDEKKKNFEEMLRKKGIADIKEYYIKKALGIGATFNSNEYYYFPSLSIKYLSKSFEKEIKKLKNMKKANYTRIEDISNSSNSIILYKEFKTIIKKSNDITQLYEYLSKKQFLENEKEIFEKIMNKDKHKSLFSFLNI